MTIRKVLSIQRTLTDTLSVVSRLPWQLSKKGRQTLSYLMYIAQFTDLYQNRELPRFKKENPGLRLSQLKELIYKAFQKSPENPFNQQNVLAYNATTEDVRSLKGIYLE